MEGLAEIERGLALAQIPEVWRGWVVIAWTVAGVLAAGAGFWLLKVVPGKRAAALEQQKQDDTTALDERKQLAAEQKELYERLERRVDKVEAANERCEKALDACQEREVRCEDALVEMTQLTKSLASQYATLESIVKVRKRERPAPAE